MNSVNPNKVAKLNALLFQLQADMIQQNNLGFFKEFETFLKKHSVADATESFVVGDVFRHRDKDCVPQYHGDNFANWYVKPFRKKVIAINFDGMKLAPEYILPKAMNDTAIQQAASSTPMSEQQFSLLLYSLMIKPKLGLDHLQYGLSKEKYYIFHVQLDSGEVVAFFVYWLGGEWHCYADRFDNDRAWHEGFVFLSLATVEI